MTKGKNKKPAATGAHDPEGLVVWARRFAEHLRVRNYSGRTIATVESMLGLFIAWAADRAITRPAEITKPILERYQRWLFYFRKPNGKPLTFSSQRVRLQKLKGFFSYLSRQNVILWNPASDLEMPRNEKRLPKAILNEREVEKVLAQADVSEPLGLRDRTIMEVLWGTGIRRHELCGLQVFDLDKDRGTATVRQGKGKKDRVVPIGERALFWIARYLDEVRPELVVLPDDGVLFLAEHGGRLDPGHLTNRLKDYIDAAKLGKTGACHIFRHSMATAMLDAGADIRVIQEILGHADASTTAIYTQVSVRRLKLVHDACHPGAKLDPKKRSPARPEVVASEADLLAALDAEAGEEDTEG